MPWRVMGWSSTSRTFSLFETGVVSGSATADIMAAEDDVEVTGFFLAVIFMGSGRIDEAAFYFCARGGLGSDSESSANHRRAIRHEAHARARAIRAGGIEAAAVVLDRQRLVVLGEIERNGNAA